jgi:hypothetical protein
MREGGLKSSYCTIRCTIFRVHNKPYLNIRGLNLTFDRSGFEAGKANRKLRVLAFLSFLRYIEYLSVIGSGKRCLNGEGG